MGKKAGTATITAQYKGKKYQCKVTVKEVPFQKHKTNIVWCGALYGTNGREVILYWEKVPEASGYEIRCTYLNGTVKQTIITGNKTQCYKNGVIEDYCKEPMELAVRAYKVSNGEKIYTAWARQGHFLTND